MKCFSISIELRENKCMNECKFGTPGAFALEKQCFASDGARVLDISIEV